MCYSAQIWADFRKYERFGGKLGIKGFTKLVGWTKKKGNWVKVLPKAMRRAMTDATGGVLDIATVEMAREAETEAIALIASEIGVQEARLVEANAKLAPQPSRPRRPRTIAALQPTRLRPARRSSTTWPRPRRPMASIGFGRAILPQ